MDSTSHNLRKFGFSDFPFYLYVIKLLKMKKITNWNVIVTSEKQFNMVLEYIKTIHPNKNYSDHMWNSYKRLYISCDENDWNYNKTIDGYECFSSKTRITWDEFLKMSGFTGELNELNELANCVVENDDFETLKDGQQITLFNREYNVILVGEWWLSCHGSGLNSIIFEDAGIEDRFAFQKEILGYRDQSSSSKFPECKTAKDLTKFVNAIKNYKKQTIHMQKELIGYKLSGKASANQIAKFLDCASDITEIDGHDLFFINNVHPVAIQKAQDAGVLDIWFEPVYSSKPQYKVGDWVTVISDRHISHTTSNNPTFQITGLNKQGVHSKLTGTRGWIYFGDIRKATPAEIEAAQSIKIDSYKVEIVSRTITKIAGFTFTKDFWEAAAIVNANTKAAVFVGCGAKSEVSVHKWQVTQETIGKILKAMESK